MQLHPESKVSPDPGGTKNPKTLHLTRVEVKSVPPYPVPQPPRYSQSESIRASLVQLGVEIYTWTSSHIDDTILFPSNDFTQQSHLCY